MRVRSHDISARQYLAFCCDSLGRRELYKDGKWSRIRPRSDADTLADVSAAAARRRGRRRRDERHVRKTARPVAK